jgi:hypothetical protein
LNAVRATPAFGVKKKFQMNTPHNKLPAPKPKEAPPNMPTALQRGNQKKTIAAKMGRIVHRYQGK